MNITALHNLRLYWDRLRAGRVAPFRAELDPREFEDVLENMFILEQLGPNQIRVRLAGMALCEMMGMEVRGMPPEAFMAAPHRDTFSQYLNSVLSAPAVLELDLSAEEMGGDRIPAHMLLLPLRSDFGEVTRILGCVMTDGHAVRAPVNFSIVAERSTVITADQGAEADTRHPGFSEAQASYAPPPAASALRKVIDNPAARGSAPRRGHLKLISND